MVLLNPPVHPAVQDRLRPIEHLRRYQRFVHPRKHFPRALQPDYSHVERVVQDAGEAVERDPSVGVVSEPPRVHLLLQSLQAVCAGRVQLEYLPDQGRFRRIRYFRFARSPVQIADGRLQRIKPLLQAAVQPLDGFLTQVSDVVGGDDRWTSGPRENALFAKRVPRLDVRWTPLRIELDWSRPDKVTIEDKHAQLALCLLLVRDLRTRRIPFGFGVNRGQGTIDVESCAVEGDLPDLGLPNDRLRRLFGGETVEEEDIQEVKAAWAAAVEREFQLAPEEPDGG